MARRHSAFREDRRANRATVSQRPLADRAVHRGLSRAGNVSRCALASEAMVEAPEELGDGSGVHGPLAGLLPVLKRLDSLLERAVVQARPAYGTAPGPDPFRGLYNSPEQADRMISREPGGPLLFAGSDVGDHLGEGSPLSGLARVFSLLVFDLDV